MNASATEAARRVDALRTSKGFNEDAAVWIAALLTEIAGMNYLVALNILTPERRDAILDPNL